MQGQWKIPRRGLRTSLPVDARVKLLFKLLLVLSLVFLTVGCGPTYELKVEELYTYSSARGEEHLVAECRLYAKEAGHVEAEIRLWHEGKPTPVYGIYSDDTYPTSWEGVSERVKLNGDYTYYDEVRVIVNDEYSSTWKPDHGEDYKVKHVYGPYTEIGGAFVDVMVYGGSGGEANVRVELCETGRDRERRIYGERDYHFERGETALIEIPLNLKGYTWYEWIEVFINGERYHW